MEWLIAIFASTVIAIAYFAVRVFKRRRESSVLTDYIDSSTMEIEHRSSTVEDLSDSIELREEQSRQTSAGIKEMGINDLDDHFSSLGL